MGDVTRADGPHSGFAGAASAAAEGGPCNTPLLQPGEAELGQLWSVEVDYVTLTMGTADGDELASKLVLKSNTGPMHGYHASQRWYGMGRNEIVRLLDPSCVSPEFGGLDYETWQFPGDCARLNLPTLLAIPGARCSRIDWVFRFVVADHVAPRVFEPHLRRFLGERGYDELVDFKGRPQSRASMYVHWSRGLVRAYREDWSPNHRHAYLIPETAPPKLMRIEVQSQRPDSQGDWAVLRQSRERGIALAAGRIAKVCGVQVWSEVLPPPRVEDVPSEAAVRVHQMLFQYGELLQACRAAKIDLRLLLDVKSSQRAACRMRQSRFARTVAELKALGPSVIAEQVVAMMRGAAAPC